MLKSAKSILLRRHQTEESTMFPHAVYTGLYELTEAELGMEPVQASNVPIGFVQLKDALRGLWLKQKLQIYAYAGGHIVQKPLVGYEFFGRDERQTHERMERSIDTKQLRDVLVKLSRQVRLVTCCGLNQVQFRFVKPVTEVVKIELTYIRLLDVFIQGDKILKPKEVGFVLSKDTPFTPNGILGKSECNIYCSSCTSQGKSKWFRKGTTLTFGSAKKLVLDKPELIEYDSGKSTRLGGNICVGGTEIFPVKEFVDCSVPLAVKFHDREGTGLLINSKAVTSKSHVALPQMVGKLDLDHDSENNSLYIAFLAYCKSQRLQSNMARREFTVAEVKPDTQRYDLKFLRYTVAADVAADYSNSFSKWVNESLKGYDIIKQHWFIKPRTYLSNAPYFEKLFKKYGGTYSPIPKYFVLKSPFVALFNRDQQLLTALRKSNAWKQETVTNRIMTRAVGLHAEEVSFTMFPNIESLGEYRAHVSDSIIRGIVAKRLLQVDKKELMVFATDPYAVQLISSAVGEHFTGHEAAEILCALNGSL